MTAPNLNFYSTSGTTLTTFNFGSITAGQESDTLEAVIWNNKDGIFSVDDAVNVVVAARVETASEINDPIDNGWIYVKSNGVENPDSVENFFDDVQPEFTQINRFNNLIIGNIPENCGRHVFVKVIVPTLAPSQANVSIRLVAGTGIQYYPLPYFFNRAFGDGIVDNLVGQIFPPILQQRIGLWTDVVAVSGGAYTGRLAKDYLIRIASGTTIGYFTYEVSDDGGSSYSTPITSSTSSFTEVTTSNDEDEGVTIKWQSTAGQSLAVGDLWELSVGVDPFHFIAGISSSLEGWIGHGEALVYNNRIFTQTPNRITGLTSNNTTYVFLNSSGIFDTSLSANPQLGKLLLGSFETDSTKVTNVYKVAPKVTLGLDLYDDFAPIFSSIGGLTWTYYRGKYREFNEVIELPGNNQPFGTLTLLAGVTNYLQIDAINRQIINKSTGYDIDNVPLFRIETGSTYIKAWEDDRTRIGLINLSRSFVATISTIPNGGNTGFTISDFFTRGNVKKFTITPTQVGGTYGVLFYENPTFADLEYHAGDITGAFTDYVDWWHHDQTKNKKFHGIVQNFTGATSNFTFDMFVERFA